MPPDESPTHSRARMGDGGGAKGGQRRRPGEDAAASMERQSQMEPSALEKKVRVRRGGNPRATAPRKWESWEDDALRNAVETHGEKQWKSIAEHVPGRNHVQCLQRWKKVLKPGLKKGHWTEEEDQLLRQLVFQAREEAAQQCTDGQAPGATHTWLKNWGVVAAKISGRTAKQCRERWCNHLDPGIKKGWWTGEEDAKILQAQAQMGNRWSHISSMLPGRTENAVKIRYKSMVRKQKQENAAAAQACASGVAAHSLSGHGVYPHGGVGGMGGMGG